MKVSNKLSVVYDITRRCPWNCRICCMGAVPSCEALANELPLERKLSLMDDLAEVNDFREVHIDFSGGEIFTNDENILVVEKAASLLGKDRVGISSSGYRMSDSLAKRLSQCVSDFEMTMDVVPGREYSLRPTGYALAAANALPHLHRYGVKTGIQTVLAHSNCNKDNLHSIYDYLCEHGVNNWSLLKFYPSGRGAEYTEERLSEEEEAWVISFIRELDKKNLSSTKPEIDFHYTMKGHKKHSTECRCVRKSIGIMPDGIVTSCFWAISGDMSITDNNGVLSFS